MAQLARPFSVHYVLLMDHNRAREATQWYAAAFGAILVHEEWGRSGGPRNPLIVTRTYLRLGPVGHHVIIEISDTVRPAVLENPSHAMMCIYTYNVVGLLNRAIGQHAQHQMAEGHGDHVLHRIRDHFGYIWVIGAVNLIPQAILPQASPAHYLLLVDHYRVRAATQWYTAAFGAAVLHEEWGVAAGPRDPRVVTRAFLRLGPVGRHVIIEIWDTVRPPVEENPSEEMLCMYTENLAGFLARAVGQGAVRLSSEGHGNHALHRLRDQFGYLWIIGTANLIPQQVLNLNN